MRLFYDVYTSRKRAELLLLVADYGCALTAILFASGIFERPDRAVVAPLLAVWALIPRSVASYLSWFERPREWMSSLGLSFLLSVFVGTLIFAGWELVWESAPFAMRPRTETALAIVVAWTAGFMVCIPRAYRLSDFMLSAVVVLGLLERQSDASLWVPAFFLFLLLSAAARHLTLDIFPREKRAVFNLQNARAVTILGGIAATPIFLAIAFALHGLLDANAPEQGWRGFGRSDRRRDGFYKSASDSRPASRTGPNRGSGRGGGGPNKQEEELPSTTLKLSELENPRYDPTVILAARVIDERGEEVTEAPDWEPRAFLWKASTLTRFNAKNAAWEDTSKYTRREWPDNGISKRERPRGDDSSLRMEVLVLEPVVPQITAPYFVEEIGPVDPRTKKSYFLESDAGDVLVRAPGFERGYRYTVKFHPWQATFSPLPKQPTRGTHDNLVYTQYPSDEEVGVDLKALAQQIGLNNGTIQARIRQLRTYLADNFQYHDKAFWRGGSEKLKAFIEREKIGDCVYFATSSALLLRAGGVSTRLVVGFLGSQRDPNPERPGRVYVRNMFAHSWVEVFLPLWGWYPIDPTSWVPTAPDYIPPPQLA
ncbi:MAG: transglutaminase-like domain-containing protein [Planctomycetota bacterium]